MEILGVLIEWDRELLVNINSLNTPFWDNIMWWISDRFVWIPLYLSIVFFLFKIKGRDAMIAALAVGLCVLIADQVASGFCKPFFERLRPSHDPELKDIIHIVNNYRSALYGFCSSHASNTFGIATLTCLLFRNKWYAALIYSWAVLNCYSRMYLGVHFPLDIICGALVGVAAGYIPYYLYKYVVNKFIYFNADGGAMVNKQVLCIFGVYVLTFVFMIGYSLCNS
jgi:undecaprenyl-diphosphatase